MTQDATKILLAAFRLSEAFGTYKAAAQNQQLAREKLSRLEKQTAELLGRVYGSPGSSSNSIMLGYQQRFRVLKNTLVRGTAEVNRSLESFEAKLRTFEGILNGQQTLLSEQAGAAVLERQSDAAGQRVLAAVLSQMLSDRRADVEGIPDECPAESHSYIPYSISQFFELLLRTDALLSNDPDFDDPDQRYRPVRFLEIGSGPGRNLLLVKLSKILLVESVTGFDISESMIAQGRLAYGFDDELKVADALTFDYGGRDVMFSYRPIRDPEIQSQLEAQIARTMDKGAYLIAPLAEDLARYGELDRVGASPDIWKKMR
jgi:hypothetical protein